MKRKQFFGATLLLFLFCLFISCNKELSCENCLPGVNNLPPVAIAGPDVTLTLPTDSILLNGNNSHDPDGSIVAWHWNKISGPASFSITHFDAAVTPVHSLAQGVYLFELKVTDNGGASASDTVQVTVNAAGNVNHPPVACAGPDKTITLPTSSVTLDGTCSTDPDQNIITYAWSKIAGPISFNFSNANTVQAQVVNLVQGTYLFELKVTDAGGLSGKDTVQILVNAAISSNQPPVACAGLDQVITLPVNSVLLNGSCSTDDQGITSYSWTKISGPASFQIANSTAAQTQVTGLVQGNYLFELGVVDAGGLFDFDTMMVTVLAPVNCTPVNCPTCKIAFVSDRDGNPEIYTCASDGTNITRITNNSANDDQPKWSPNGGQIAFVSNRSGSPDIYIMNADGSNVVRKTFSGNCQDPCWSPDGTKIAYSTLSNGSMNLWVLNVSGGAPSLLFSAPGFEGQPSWSPDGTKILLVSDWFAYDTVWDIFMIDATGSNFTPLTGNIFDHQDYQSPAWSPCGNKIALTPFTEVGINQYNTQVAIMNPDGSGITILASNVVYNTNVSWSPDGSKIAFTSISGTGKNISWVASNGSSSGIIVSNGWNPDWQH